MRQFTAFVIVTAAVLMLGACGSGETDTPVVNENLIQKDCFKISAESSGLDTCASGTVFCESGDSTSVHIKIAAQIEIDPDDWGGVSFSFTDGWEITGALCSYPDDQTAVSYQAAIWRTADSDAEWDKMIEIGRDRLGNSPSDGGTGTVIIDLEPASNDVQPDAFNMIVAVGCEEKDGFNAVGTDTVTVNMPIVLSNNN